MTWRAYKQPGSPWWEVVEDDGHLHATVWNDPAEPAAVERYAKLIAAAPALLAMVEQFASECSTCDGTGSVYCAWAPPEKCPDCDDIREVLRGAK